MAYTSKDGQHTFPTMSRQRLYEESAGNLKRPGLSDAYKGARPGMTPSAGGQDHHRAVAEHGPAKRVTITRDEAGQHRIDAEMGDGSPYSSTQSDGNEAQDVMHALMGGGGAPTLPGENIGGGSAGSMQA